MELYLYVIYEIMQIYPKTPSYKFMTKDIVCKQNPNTHPLGYQPIIQDIYESRQKYQCVMRRYP